MPSFIDLSNKKISRLTVNSYKRTRNNKGTSIIFWSCLCDCGNIVEVTAAGVNHPERPTKSCGCLQKEAVKITGINNRQTPGLAGLNDLFRRYKRSAKLRNYEFLLNKDEFEILISNDCFYCGDEPKGLWKRENEYTRRVYNGIDRMNNNSGYLTNNCITCCSMCNQAKMDLSKEEFLAMVKKIYERSIK